MRPLLLPLTVAVFALAACATSPEQSAREARNDAAGQSTPEGFADGARLAGPAQSCIPLHQIRQSHVRSDRVIDFEMDGRQLYRNVLPQYCPQLGFEQRFAYKTSLDQLCSTDIITVLQSPGLSQGASCGLGQFQPVTLPGR